MQLQHLLLIGLLGCGPSKDSHDTQTDDTQTEDTGEDDWTPPNEGRWVPAEWDLQAAVWLVWPRVYEKDFEPAFAKIVATILNYEAIHVLTHDNNTLNSAKIALSSHGGLSDAVIDGGPTAAGFSLVWENIPNDSAWMRDTGPVYVVEDGQLRIQDWGFNAWGGAFGDFPFADDDAVPVGVSKSTGLPLDTVNLVHERGNLEFNGRDAVILNWSVIGDPERNLGLNKEVATAALKEWFGVDTVIWVEGVPSGDLTNGHIDGIARFIDHRRVVVADCGPNSHCSSGDPDDQIYDQAATEIEAAGFEVIRWAFPGSKLYKGSTFDTDYLNWLVGNGFVITVGFDHKEADGEAQLLLEEWFPGRDVYVIEMLDSWLSGGGIHCHTNDQPEW